MNDITLIQNKIYEIRGQRVMLDFDLAPLYQVQTKVLKQAVRRNIERFPADFMFEITIDEYNSLKDSLRSQIVTSNKGGTRYMPFAFTEQGVSMLSSVLRSDAAIQVNIAVMRAFVAMRKNPYPLVFKCLKESGVTAFFTRSSAANIPVNMSLCESLGLDKEFYSVSIPLGATINMAGAAVTITVMTLAAVHTLGITVQLPVAIILSVMAALGACGASGVAGGSLLLIPMACSLFGISNDVAMQVVGVGFIIGVIQDSVETAINSSSDALFTAVAEFKQWRKAGKEIKY